MFPLSASLLARGPVLIIGANGQLGAELASALAGLGTAAVVRACRAPGTGDVTMDLRHPDAVAERVAALAPAVVVNAAAYTAVDRAETEADLATRINAHAPRALAAACRANDALLVHFSTDYVFDGMLQRPCRESDPPAPLNEYGRGKLLGERAVAQAGGAHLVFRTSALYAPGGNNFVTTMLGLFRRERPVGVVDDQRTSPTCARRLAEALAAFLSALDALRSRRLRGIYHLSAAGDASWYEFARAIHELADPAPRAPLHPITSAAFGAPARRPANSALDCRKAREELGLSLAGWREQLHAVMPEFNQRVARDAR